MESPALFDFGIKRVATTSRDDDEDGPDEVMCEAECNEVSQSESNDAIANECSSREEQIVECVGVCCTDSSQSKPNQPRDREILGRTVRTVGLQKRFVNRDWFDRYTSCTCSSRSSLHFLHLQ